MQQMLEKKQKGWNNPVKPKVAHYHYGFPAIKTKMNNSIRQRALEIIRQQC